MVHIKRKQQAMNRLKRRGKIFLDVDGVMNAYGSESHGKLDPKLVANLNTLMVSRNLQVVFNSAWNVYGIEQLRKDFVTAGLTRPMDLIDTTARYSGGGDLVRKYLIEHDLVGTPFIIIDDGTQNYGEMWCRLAVCDGRKGFNNEVLARADFLAGKCWQPDEERDRKMAATYLMEHAMWLAFKTKWLTIEQRQHYIAASFEIATHCLTDPDFMEDAMLVAPTPPVSPESEG